MKNPFDTRSPHFDGEAIHATIQRALASAGLDTSAGTMRDVSETLRRALGAPRPGDEARGTAPGTPEAMQFTNHAGTRAYKVHVPPGQADAPRAVVVMLHGCTQSADDFAAGTRMNRLADAHGFLVVYPEQAAQANPSRCWNWFRPQDQARGDGEPSLIAGIVAEVVQRHGADPQRVFVAGLSAGAAMAVLLGETYPDRFAGVGVHSGLPCGSAHDIPSALAAMKGGRSGLHAGNGGNGAGGTAGAAGATRRGASQAVPTIVFHGDRDHTVQHANGERIVQQARAAHGARLSESRSSGTAPGGRRFSRTVYAADDGHARIEHWTLHGAGHAWSGGDAAGSYTDGTGPDASAEMLRFFMALPRA